MELDKRYNIKVEVAGKILYYSNCEVIGIDNNFVTFIDSHTKQPISYNLNVIVFYEPYLGVEK